MCTFEKKYNDDGLMVSHFSEEELSTQDEVRLRFIEMIRFSDNIRRIWVGDARTEDKDYAIKTVRRNPIYIAYQVFKLVPHTINDYAEFVRKLLNVCDVTRFTEPGIWSVRWATLCEIFATYLSTYGTEEWAKSTVRIVIDQ